MTQNLKPGSCFVFSIELQHITEWGPTDAEVAAQPALAEERERPMMMLVGVQR
jgi:hypothetical protein